MEIVCIAYIQICLSTRLFTSIQVSLRQVLSAAMVNNHYNVIR